MRNLSQIIGRPLRICLLTQDVALEDYLQSLWPTDRIAWTVFSSGRFALEQLFDDPPDMVIAEQFLPGVNGIDVLHMLRAENIYRQICAILLVRDKNLSALSGIDLDVDELVILPASADNLRIRIELALRRSTMTLDANPLTRLPGNTSIINTVQRLIAVNTDFALAYADLDHFKPYNDRYGFSRGDEVLLMTARLIANAVSDHQCKPSFTGHVGGDDFVFILPPDIVEDTCKSVISSFDAIVPSFYDDEDRARKCIFSRDRQGHELVFPILTISIAVVLNINARYTRYAQLSHVAGQLKNIAKAAQESTYVIDQRK
jgi:diguanylate cyclase (GGDEF)-like protein